MSLFERLKNKRYDLIEKKEQRDNSYLFDDDKDSSEIRIKIRKNQIKIKNSLKIQNQGELLIIRIRNQIKKLVKQEVERH